MLRDDSVRYVVELEFPDQAAARAAAGELSGRMLETARATGAIVVREEFMVDEEPIVIDMDAKLLAEFNERVDSEVDLFAPELQERLDTPLALLLDEEEDLDSTFRNRILNLTQGASITSARDILTLGKETLLDTRGIGEKAIDILESQLAVHIPEIPLMFSTTPAMAARFCTSLGQISFVRGPQRVTVEDIIRGDREAILARLGVTNLFFTRQLLPDAQEYARKFEEAKATPAT